MAAQEPPALVDEMVEEILLRVPPDDPARLMRAAAACKPWCRLICGQGFRRRFREHHGSPPLLGIVMNTMNRDGAKLARFVPATGSCFRPRRTERINWLAIDSRHGCVLLRSSFSNSSFSVAVWDPITDELLKLPATPWTTSSDMFNYKAAVICAGDGCDHLDCHGKPFLVVFVGVSGFENKMSSYVYSSETNAWTGLAHDQYFGRLWQSTRSTLVGNALYFVVNRSPRILKYNLGTREATAISCPPMTNPHIALMTAEGGGLGCATMTSSELRLWSAEVGPAGDIGWAQCKTVELSTLVPAGHFIREFDVASSANGDAIVHVVTKEGYRSFTTNLKSGQFSEIRGTGAILENMVPYMSFYIPALKVAYTTENPRAGEPPARSSEVIKNLAPAAFSDEGLPRKKKLVEAIGQSKAAQKDKDAKKRGNKSNKNGNEDK